jgi:NADP-dependent aldehyde dehydrogenase
LAFNSASGGDFAAAVAAGNCVIAKANSSHPGTTRLLAEEALAAAQATSMPPAIVQLLYRLDHADGERLVAHPQIGATGYTGSRAAGLALKRAADAAGKPIYLELSSINPVVVLPGALRERGEHIADEFHTSCLMGTGQFCTNPGLVLLLKSAETEAFVSAAAKRFADAPVGTLLSEGVAASLARNVQTLLQCGAQLVAGGSEGGGKGFSYQNTLLTATAKLFLEHPATMQTEAFGNESLFVLCDDRDELLQVIESLEGNLTGCIYSHSGEEEEDLYDAVAARLREKVGRLLNDKMPTGVAVVPSMNHGGPYPATGHPGFTAVGLPASMLRFTALRCYDNVREQRLPSELRDHNSTNTPWRFIDGSWTRGDAP